MEFLYTASPQDPDPVSDKGTLSDARPPPAQRRAASLDTAARRGRVYVYKIPRVRHATPVRDVRYYWTTKPFQT